MGCVSDSRGVDGRRRHRLRRTDDLGTGYPSAVGVGSSSAPEIALQFTGRYLPLVLLFLALAGLAAAVGVRGVAGLTLPVVRVFVLVFLALGVVALVL